MNWSQAGFTVTRMLTTSPQLLLGNYRRVFLLSHMRSYSSLLTHILGEHPEILGIGELHISYEYFWSGLLQKYRLYKNCGSKSSANMLCDKLLHSHCILPDKLIEQDHVHVIVCLRSPQETLPSIVRLGKDLLKSNDGWEQPDQAFEYYTKRLRDLQNFAINHSKKFIYIDASDIILNPECTLGYISQYLKLNEPLEPTYVYRRSTVESNHITRVGDPSEQIRSGKIMSSQSRNWERYIGDFSEKTMNDAMQIYQSSRQKIMQHQMEFI